MSLKLFTFSNHTSTQPDCSVVWDSKWSRVPIVIDNGAYNCRVGFASNSQPSLVFKNVVNRPRGQRRVLPLVGNDIPDLEAVRHQLRTPFDRNLVTQLDVQEQVLDHAFSRMGISGERLDCPIVMNEAVCNPLSCRAQMSQLLFECYGAHSVCYYVDALAALLHTGQTDELPDGALVVAVGYHTTHVLPVLNGRLDANNALRMNLGGAYMDWYMQRLIQLRHPQISEHVTLSRAEELVHRFGRFTSDYPTEIEFAAKERILVQLPILLNNKRQWSSLANPQSARDALRRRREERLRLSLERRTKLLEVVRVARTGSRPDSDPVLAKALRNCGLADYLQLIILLEASSSTARRLTSLLHNEECPGDAAAAALIDKDMLSSRFSLVDALDIRLDSQMTREKRRQLSEWFLLERSRSLRQQRVLDRTWRLNATRRLAGDVGALEQRRTRMLERRQSRRAKRQSDLERRQRVNLLKGTLGPEAAVGSETLLAEDGGDSSESEAEAEELVLLDEMLVETAQYVVERPETAFQFTMDSECLRVPELLYRPSLMGIEQAGLAECIGTVLQRYSKEDKQCLLANGVALTGAYSQLAGASTRLQSEVRQLWPIDWPLASVRQAKQPALAAWLGARRVALQSGELARRSITRSLYDECGADYLEEHGLANSYVTPLK